MHLLFFFFINLPNLQNVLQIKLFSFQLRLCMLQNMCEDKAMYFFRLLVKFSIGTINQNQELEKLELLEVSELEKIVPIF